MIARRPGGRAAGSHRRRCIWGSDERLADNYGFKGAEREWFIYYSTTTKFPTNAKTPEELEQWANFPRAPPAWPP